MFRFSTRGLKILAVLCVAALLFVYPLQKSTLAENSENSSEYHENKNRHILFVCYCLSQITVFKL